MLNKRIEELLNLQMNREIESAYIYLAMTNYLAENNLNGAVSFMELQSNEELEHANKIKHYLIERGGKVIVKGFENPNNEYSSLLEILEAALNHEKFVTKSIHDILEAATQEKDYATQSFLKWFVDEQVEEEAQFEDLIAKAKLLKDGVGLYLLDKELAKRE